MNDNLLTHIKTDNQAVTEQVTRLLEFYLAGLESRGIESITIEVTAEHDGLGTRLYHCRVRADNNRQQMMAKIDETQTDLDLAVNRALERCIRILHRKHARLRFDISA